MTPEVLADRVRPWLRAEHAPAFEAALEWLWPRCRTEEERLLAPALLVFLAPFNALVVPCRPVEGNCVNFQVTLSREGAAGPERIRGSVRAGTPPLGRDEGNAASMALYPVSDGEQLLPEVWLQPTAVAADPLVSAARVIAALIPGEAAA
jgi:hypothetical protein